MAEPKESKPEDLLEGANTENIESDSKTSLVGEEIPETIESEQREIEEGLLDDVPTPSEPETPVPAKEGIKEELSPLEQEFVKRGLDKQFGTLEGMMDRVPALNKHVNDLSVERKELMRLKEQAPRPEPVKAPSSDDFFDEPIPVIQGLIDRRYEEFNQRFDAMEANSFINSKSDYSDMEPLMEEALASNPGMRTLGIKALEPLYLMAKAKQLSSVPAPATQPAPKKTSAETSVGKKSPPVEKDAKYWQGKSLEEMEKELGVAQQYDD